MNQYIQIHKAAGTWVVRAGGAVIGESKRALELIEGQMAPVIYIPREDVAMAFLDPSPTRSNMPGKGEAHHFTIVGRNGPIRDAAWSYEAPAPGLEKIAGYLSFYPEKVALERL